MKILLLFLLLATGKDSVYVCTGSMAYAYHKTADCKGLTECTKKVRKESKEEALQQKRKPCKVCRP